MATPDDLERQFTLLTAAARYDQLRLRDALAPPGDEGGGGDAAPLTRDEALELLALGEVIMRKASYGRQLAVRTARAMGASWSQIGAALGTSKQSAWETHLRWIEDQAEQHREDGHAGAEEQDSATAHALTGDLDAKETS
jgi:hypothetical protein